MNSLASILVLSLCVLQCRGDTLPIPIKLADVEAYLVELADCLLATENKDEFQFVVLNPLSTIVPDGTTCPKLYFKYSTENRKPRLTFHGTVSLKGVLGQSQMDASAAKLYFDDNKLKIHGDGFDDVNLKDYSIVAIEQEELPHSEPKTLEIGYVDYGDLLAEIEKALGNEKELRKKTNQKRVELTLSFYQNTFTAFYNREVKTVSFPNIVETLTPAPNKNSFLKREQIPGMVYYIQDNDLLLWEPVSFNPKLSKASSSFRVYPVCRPKLKELQKPLNNRIEMSWDDFNRAAQTVRPKNKNAYGVVNFSAEISLYFQRTGIIGTRYIVEGNVKRGKHSISELCKDSSSKDKISDNAVIGEPSYPLPLVPGRIEKKIDYVPLTEVKQSLKAIEYMKQETCTEEDTKGTLIANIRGVRMFVSCTKDKKPFLRASNTRIMVLYDQLDNVFKERAEKIEVSIKYDKRNDVFLQNGDVLAEMHGFKLAPVSINEDDLIKIRFDDFEPVLCEVERFMREDKSYTYKGKGDEKLIVQIGSTGRKYLLVAWLLPSNKNSLKRGLLRGDMYATLHYSGKFRVATDDGSSEVQDTELQTYGGNFYTSKYKDAQNEAGAFLANKKNSWILFAEKPVSVKSKNVVKIVYMAKMSEVEHVLNEIITILKRNECEKSRRNRQINLTVGIWEGYDIVGDFECKRGTFETTTFDRNGLSGITESGKVFPFRGKLSFGIGKTTLELTEDVTEYVYAFNVPKSSRAIKDTDPSVSFPDGSLCHYIYEVVGEDERSSGSSFYSEEREATVEQFV